VHLKPIVTHGEGRPRRFPPNKEGIGRGMGSSQAHEAGLGHPCAIYLSPNLFQLLTCLNSTWKKTGRSMIGKRILNLFLMGYFQAHFAAECLTAENFPFNQYKRRHFQSIS
jgi:hypothetical protein